MTHENFRTSKLRVRGRNTHCMASLQNAGLILVTASLKTRPTQVQVTGAGSAPQVTLPRGAARARAQSRARAAVPCSQDTRTPSVKAQRVGPPRVRGGPVWAGAWLFPVTWHGDSSGLSRGGPRWLQAQAPTSPAQFSGGC